MAVYIARACYLMLFPKTKVLQGKLKFKYTWIYKNISSKKIYTLVLTRVNELEEFFAEVISDRNEATEIISLAIVWNSNRLNCSFQLKYNFEHSKKLTMNKF